ncbi:MAG TPA: PEGA domain-containing protein, partial [Kofleriaceae bacterium]
TVKFGFDVQDATVHVNGTKIALTVNKELALPVGTHAVTVTHPQYHNFVKFVEVGYGRTTDVQVTMKQYPIVEHSIQGKAGTTDTIIYDDPPMWRRPYVAVPVIIGLAVAAGFAAAWYAREFPDYDNCRKVGGEGC